MRKSDCPRPRTGTLQTPVCEAKNSTLAPIFANIHCRQHAGRIGQGVPNISRTVHRQCRLQHFDDYAKQHQNPRQTPNIPLPLHIPQDKQKEIQEKMYGFIRTLRQMHIRFGIQTYSGQEQRISPRQKSVKITWKYMLDMPLHPSGRSVATDRSF